MTGKEHLLGRAQWERNPMLPKKLFILKQWFLTDSFQWTLSPSFSTSDHPPTHTTHRLVFDHGLETHPHFCIALSARRLDQCPCHTAGPWPNNQATAVHREGQPSPNMGERKPLKAEGWKLWKLGSGKNSEAAGQGMVLFFRLREKFGPLLQVPTSFFTCPK